MGDEVKSLTLPSQTRADRSSVRRGLRCNSTISIGHSLITVSVSPDEYRARRRRGGERLGGVRWIGRGEGSPKVTLHRGAVAPTCEIEWFVVSCSWYFREMNRKQSRQGDIPTKHALDEDLETFVREVLQNANDAGPIHEDEPVHVTFRFERLSGDDRERFLKAMDWGRMREHLDAAAEEETDLSLRQFLEEDDELVLLTIEDRNTAGLSGQEDADESNYTALVRDMHRSNKDETQGGSHGVGGTVLWAFSGLSTVLFTSNPAEHDRRHPRFVGRSYLPDHVIDGRLYKGYGWFGASDPRDTEGRHVSVWGQEATEITTALGVRRPDVVGTSETIVGFRVPGESQPGPDRLDEVAEDIRETAVENFWPAILRGDLEVHVETPGDDDPRPADLESVEHVQPFVDAYTSMHDEGQELEEPGDTNEENVQFDFPPRSDGTRTPESGTVTVSIRKPGPADEERRNQIAIFRGSGMVVQYVDLSDVAKYGSDFHGILAAGEARNSPVRDPDDDDRQVEHLLRVAEPAAHNEWTGTPRLKNEYQRNGAPVSTVQRLQGGLLRDTVRSLVGSGDDDGEQRVRNVEKWFPSPDQDDDGPERNQGPNDNPTPSVTQLDTEVNDLSFEGDQWSVDVTLEPNLDRENPGGDDDAEDAEDEAERWKVNLWLVRLLEGGGEGEELGFDTVESLEDTTDGAIDGIDPDGRAFVEASSAGRVRIRCTSRLGRDSNPLLGQLSRTGVRKELSTGEEVET